MISYVHIRKNTLRILSNAIIQTFLTFLCDYKSETWLAVLQGLEKITQKKERKGDYKTHKREL